MFLSLRFWESDNIFHHVAWVMFSLGQAPGSLWKQIEFWTIWYQMSAGTFLSNLIKLVEKSAWTYNLSKLSFDWTIWHKTAGHARCQMPAVSCRNDSLCSIQQMPSQIISFVRFLTDWHQLIRSINRYWLRGQQNGRVLICGLFDRTAPLQNFLNHTSLHQADIYLYVCRNKYLSAFNNMTPNHWCPELRSCW